MTQSRMTTKKFQALLSTVLSADDTACTLAMRELVDRHFMYSVSQSQAILNLLPLQPEITNNLARYKAVLRLLHYSCLSRAATQKYQQQLIDEVWRGLTHSNGTIRESARRLLESARSVGSLAGNLDLDTTALGYIRLLDEVEQKLQKYRPQRQPISVTTASPSVYKTLTLVWYDLADIPIVERAIDVTQRMRDHHIMPYDAPDQAGELYDFEQEDWQAHIQEHAIWQQPDNVRGQLEQLQERSLHFLEWALIELGVTHLRDKIVYHARFDEQQALRVILHKVAEPILSSANQSEYELTAFRINKFARAIQCLANNSVHESHGGLPFSTIVCDAILHEDEKLLPHKVAVDPFMAAFTAAHTAIDQLADIQVRAAQAEHIALSAHMAALGIVDEVFQQSDLTEPVQIVHYMLDKLPSADYKHIIRQSPEKIAAGLWYLFARESPWLSLPGLSPQELTEYAGWASASGISGAAQQYKYLIEQSLHDPAILLCINTPEELAAAQTLLGDDNSEPRA